MDVKQHPETPNTWEVAKRVQGEAASKVRDLLDDFDRHGYWPGCFKQLGEAVREFTDATEALELADRDPEE